jgi:hypothetical protein
MAPNIVLVSNPGTRTPTGFPSIPANALVSYKGNFGATQAGETTTDILPVAAYRSAVFSIQALAWGTGTVAVKIYPCDSQGNTNTNAFFSLSFTANTGPVLLFLSEMGGAVTAATYPGTAATTGSIIGPFGNYLKITEQMTAFTSGTNTVTIEVALKA